LLCCITEIQGNRFIYYGFNVCGHWKDEDYYPLEDIDTEATPQEVETALIAEAKKRGFKEGVSFCRSKDLLLSAFLHPSVNTEAVVTTPLILGDNNNLWTKDGCIIFSKGIWATITEDNKLNELEKKYEELGKEIQRLKK